MKTGRVALRVNGEPVELAVAPETTLLDVLREDLGLMPAKDDCALGECCACAVLVDGRPMLSCLLPASECQSTDVTTVESLDGHPDPLQQALADRVRSLRRRSQRMEVRRRVQWNPPMKGSWQH